VFQKLAQQPEVKGWPGLRLRQTARFPFTHFQLLLGRDSRASPIHGPRRDPSLKVRRKRGSPAKSA
jgi:hypothetical protein